MVVLIFSNCFLSFANNFSSFGLEFKKYKSPAIALNLEIFAFCSLTFLSPFLSSMVNPYLSSSFFCFFPISSVS